MKEKSKIKMDFLKKEKALKLDYENFLKYNNFNFIKNELNRNTNHKNSFLLSTEIKPMYSLLDINDKLTNRRSTSIQPKLKKLLKEQQKKFNTQISTNKKDNKNKLTIETNIIKIKKIPILKDFPKLQKINTCRQNLNIKEHLSKLDNIPKIKKLKINDIEIKKDRWKPEGLKLYEDMVKNHKLFFQKIKKEQNYGECPSYKEEIEINKKSDIFFMSPPTKKEIGYKKFLNEKLLLNKNIKTININYKKGYNNCRSLSTGNLNPYNISDIFFTHNDNITCNKCSEKYIFNERLKTIKNNPFAPYTSSKESKSEWKVKSIDAPSLFNCPSVNYDLLNSQSPSISPCKDNIIEEYESKRKNLNKKNDIKLNSDNLINPAFKRKGFSEYIDITRSSNENILKDYKDNFFKNPNCFKKINNVCSSFQNLYGEYKGIITDRPFIKESH